MFVKDQHDVTHVVTFPFDRKGRPIKGTTRIMHMEQKCR